MKRNLYTKAMKADVKYEEDSLLESTFYTIVKRKNTLNRPNHVFMLMKKYRSHGYKDIFGITLKEYLDMSPTEMSFLEDCRNVIIEEENEEMNKLLKEEEDIVKVNNRGKR